MKSFWNFFLSHRQFTVLVMITLMAMGAISLIRIPKESNPEVKVPIAVVVTPLPGASASDVESLVTNKLERPLKNNLDDLDKITSTSAEGSSSITVEFDASADLEVAINDLRDEVDKAKPELPEEAEDPQIIRIDFGAEPVLTLSLASDVPEPALYALGEELQDQIEDLSGVSTVNISGIRNREVQVLLNRARLSEFGLTPGDVSRAIAAANVSTPAGSIEIDGVDYPVRFEGDLENILDVAGVPVTAVGGAPVYVRDVARVVDGYAEASTLSRTSLGGEIAQSAVTLDVFKATNANITGVSSTVNDYLEEAQLEGGLLSDTQVSIVFDRGDLLFEDLSTLGMSGVQTTLLVVLVLAIAIGWREALIAGTAIPLSILIAFMVMFYSGNTLNFVSLFALVLSVGIIVDAAIVMVEAINTHIRKLPEEDFESPSARGIQAARNAVNEFSTPLVAGTMTTVAVFAPLFIVSGIVGEFIKSIPFTIIAVLFASLLVSIGFVPLIGARFAGRSIGGFGGKRGILINKIRGWYRNYLSEVLSDSKNATRLVTSIVLMLVFVLSLPALGALKVVFFEGGDEDFMFVEVELPQGSTLARTDIELQKVEEVLYEIPDVTSFNATVGRGSEFSGNQGASSGEKLGNAFLLLDKDRDRTSAEIADDLRERLAKIQSSLIRVGELENGPPSGAPVLVTFFGDDLSALEDTANRVASALAKIPGTTDITTSTRDNEPAFVFEFDRAQAIASGITTRDAAGTLRTTVFGSTATVLRGIDEDVDVVVRVDLNGASDPEIARVTDAETLLLTPLSGSIDSPALFGSFADVMTRESRSVIRHENGERISSVSANVSAAGNAIEISNELQRQIDSGEIPIPRGVRTNIGGEREDVDQSFTDMFVALILGLIGMFAILVLQFNSFRLAWYVLMTVPLSLIGVFAGLLIADKPISFPSIMGFIALAGIVVNNAIILIDTIEETRKNLPLLSIKDAVIESAVSRLRPVVLTTITTVIGIMPLMFTAELWVPLALAIMFGLAFATILTLVLVPVVYVRWPSK